MSREHALGIVRKVDSHIKSHGQSIVTVDDPSGIQSFAYTIGNHALGFPELLILDFVAPAGAVLNDLHRKMIRRGRAFDDGELVSFGGQFPVRIQVAPEVVKSKYTLLATSKWGNGYAVMQVVVPDLAGHFPDDAAYNKNWPKQIISGHH